MACGPAYVCAAELRDALGPEPAQKPLACGDQHAVELQMSSGFIRKLVIVGGGTAGWMTAAALGKLFGEQLQIRLIESEDIGTVGVGEATIPQIRLFNATIGLDENEFIRETQGSFKLGIEFDGWLREGEAYMHAFGPIGGRDLGLVPFYHYWVKQFRAGKAGPLGDYTFNAVAAYQNKFLRAANIPNSPLSNVHHAFHFDAGLYAKFLRKHAEGHGVQRIEGKVVDVGLNGESGHITHVQLENGENVDGELFIDCSGFRGLLIEQTLNTGYHDWRQWLPCDRAMAVPCASVQPLTPYTRATARTAGWQWRIPLQHRIGNGMVYCSDYISEDEAAHTLLSHLDGAALAEPRPLRFVTGMRKQFWNKNCIAIGLSSGFMEPLESTSIHFIQSSIGKLVAFFPQQGFSQLEIDEFNRQLQFEFIRSRDFLVLHYIANQRTEPFWQRCREMAIPDTLADKIALFREAGRVFKEHEELFTEPSWVQVMIGQGIVPERYHPMVETLGDAETQRMVDGVGAVLQRAAQVMPDHQDYISKTCAAANA